jgi:hypothetical protein
MFNIFYADLNLSHPKVIDHSNLIKEQFWQHDFLQNKRRRETFGKLLYFLSNPEKIENKITVFFLDGKIRYIHPGQGRLVCYQGLGYETIPIIGVKFVNYKIPSNLVSNVSYENVNIDLIKESEYWLINQLNHVDIVPMFSKKRVDIIELILKKNKISKLFFYYNNKFICRIARRKGSAQLHVDIENGIGYFNFCRYLCGVSTSQEGFTIRSK